MTTLYDILGVPEDAAPEQIKQAYRRAAMQSHPDRNAGREDQARATFQRVKEAYAILSDPEQRRVYDAVFAEELARLQALHGVDAHVGSVPADDTPEPDSHYAECVSLAMRLAERGHGRDVLFGAMLARDCDDLLAARIADGVAALHSARRGQPRTDGGDTAGEHSADEARNDAVEPAAAEPPRSDTPPAGSGLFAALWQGVFGLRS
jgi:curved DNA-binding protein CbpA